MLFNGQCIKYYFYGIFCSVSFYSLNDIQAAVFVLIFFTGFSVGFFSQSTVFFCRANFSIIHMMRVCFTSLAFAMGVVLPSLLNQKIAIIDDNFLGWFSLMIFAFYVTLFRPLERTMTRRWHSIENYVTYVVGMLAMASCIWSERLDYSLEASFVLHIIWFMKFFVVAGAYCTGKIIVIAISQSLSGCDCPPLESEETNNKTGME